VNCPRCGTVLAAGCQCSFEDSDCIELAVVDGVVTPVPIISADPDNIIECTPSGLFAKMRDRFTVATVRKVRNASASFNANDNLTYDTLEYDYALTPMSFSSAEVEIPFDGMFRVTGYANFDNNDGSYNTIRLEINSGGGYSIIEASRESRDVDVVHESFLNYSNEFLFNEGDLVKFTVGEDATAGVSILQASMVVSFVSLES
jgi:hypothetical protein